MERGVLRRHGRLVGLRAWFWGGGWAGLSYQVNSFLNMASHLGSLVAD